MEGLTNREKIIAVWMLHAHKNLVDAETSTATAIYYCVCTLGINRSVVVQTIQDLGVFINELKGH